MPVMTLDELNQFLDLVQKLQKNQEILEALETQAIPGAQVLTGMPHAPGVVSKVELFAVEIADMKERIRAQETEITARREPVEAFIGAIEPDWLRLMFRLRFIRGFQWKEVAAIIGGANTEASVTSACYRYLEKLQNDEESC